MKRSEFVQPQRLESYRHYIDVALKEQLIAIEYEHSAGKSLWESFDYAGPLDERQRRCMMRASRSVRVLEILELKLKSTASCYAAMRTI
jgi:hypothetical protein